MTVRPGGPQLPRAHLLSQKLLDTGWMAVAGGSTLSEMAAALAVNLDMRRELLREREVGRTACRSAALLGARSGLGIGAQGGNPGEDYRVIGGEAERHDSRHQLRQGGVGREGSAKQGHRLRLPPHPQER